MQNQIMAEKLNGLNQAFNELVYKKSSENLLCEEFELISRNMRHLCQSAQDTEAKLLTTSAENISLWTELKEMQSLKLEAQDQLEKLTTKVKERFNRYSEDIKSLNFDKEKQRLELEVAEKNNKSLADEYENLKIKTKQLMSKKNIDGDDINSKLCQLCKNVYKEEENFNWSCKVHFSQYSGEY